MKKKVLTAIITVALVATLAACGNDDPTVTDPPIDNSVAQSEETPSAPEVDMNEPEINLDAVPEGAEDWDDEDWDEWFNNKTDDDTVDVWDESDWDDSSWTDEYVDEASVALTSSEEDPSKYCSTEASLNSLSSLSSNDKSLSDLLSHADTEGSGLQLTKVNAAITMERAKELFADAHPEGEILVVRPQNDGSSFYIYGVSGNNKIKMIISASDGQIILDKTIPYMGQGATATPQPAETTPGEGAEGAGEGAEGAGEGAEGAGEGAVGTTVDEAGAKEIFSSFYPNATILKCQLQDGGKAYYIFGQDEDSRFKMKILTANGQVVMNRSNHSGRGNYQNYSNTPAAENSTTQTGAVDIEKAKEIFSATYPGVTISTAELQDGGKNIYLFGMQDNTKYIMKVRVSDGSIIMSKSINIGGRGGYNNSNQQQNNQGENSQSDDSSDTDNSSTDATSSATEKRSSGTDANSGATQNRGSRNNNRGGRR